VSALLLARPGDVVRPHPWHHEPIVSAAVDTTALMLRVQQGDQRAFADLYDEISPIVFGVVKRVLRDPSMSEEVTQEVFVEIWKTCTRFDPERASVPTWAATMARRRAVDRVRREQSQRNRIDELAQQPLAHDERPDDTVVASLDAERIERAMASLPDDQREVIRLAFIDGHAHGAIAEILDIPLGTVKGRVRGGLKRMRSTIGDAR